MKIERIRRGRRKGKIKETKEGTCEDRGGGRRGRRKVKERDQLKIGRERDEGGSIATVFRGQRNLERDSFGG